MAGQDESVDLARPAPLSPLFVSAGCHDTDNGMGLAFRPLNLSVVSGIIDL